MSEALLKPAVRNALQDRWIPECWKLAYPALSLLRSASTSHFPGYRATDAKSALHAAALPRIAPMARVPVVCASNSTTKTV